MLKSNIANATQKLQDEYVREMADEYGADLEICPIKGYVQERGTYAALMSGSDKQ